MKFVARTAVAAALVSLAVPALAGADGETMVARVGDREISRRLLEASVAEALATSTFHQAVSPERRSAFERAQLEVLVRRTLDLLGALDRGLNLPDGEPERLRAAIETRLGTEAYERALAEQALTRDEHRRLVGERRLAEEAHRRYAGTREDEAKWYDELRAKHPVVVLDDGLKP